MEVSRHQGQKLKLEVILKIPSVYKKAAAELPAAAFRLPTFFL